MLNKEKYRDKILEIVVDGGTVAFDKKKQTMTYCSYTHCTDCLFEVDCVTERKKWMNSEYVEPEVEWSKVPVDTPILVRDSEDEEWHKRYFNKYSNGTVCAWSDGATSWSVRYEDDFCEWDYAKLAEDVEKPQDNGWHNLKDKKPEDRQEVLTWDGLGVQEDRWSDDADYFESTDAKEIWWRQMPEPPEV